MSIVDRVAVIRSERSRSIAVAIICVLFPIAYGLFALHLGEDISYDTLNYHYFNPFWLLDNHLQDIAPAQVQTYLSPILDIPNFLLERALSARDAVFVIACMQGIAFPFLYLVAKQIVRRRWIALMLAGLGMFSANAWGEIGTSIGDNLDSIPFLVALFCVGHVIITSPGMRERRWWLLASGLFAGVGSGLKLALAPLAIGMLIASLLLDSEPRRRLLSTAQVFVGLVVGLAVSYGFWAYELGARFGNPVFPFFNDLFHSKYAPGVALFDNRWLPHGVVQLLLYPFYWAANPLRVGEEPFRELSLPICEALLLLALALRLVILVRTRKWRPMFDAVFDRYLVVSASIGLLVWAHEFGVYRYITEIEMLGFVLMWVLVRSVYGALPDVRLGPALCRVAVAALAVVCAVTEVPANWIRAPFGSSYFAVPVPKRFDHQPATILMLTGNPFSYIVPFFPPTTDFIRLEGNLLPTPYVEGVIKKRLATAENIYIMWLDPIPYPTAKAFLNADQQAWGQYGLALVKGTCAVFRTRIGGDQERIRYCRVESTGRAN